MLSNKVYQSSIFLGFLEVLWGRNLYSMLQTANQQETWIEPILY